MSERLRCSILFAVSLCLGLYGCSNNEDGSVRLEGGEPNATGGTGDADAATPLEGVQTNAPEPMPPVVGVTPESTVGPSPNQDGGQDLGAPDDTGAPTAPEVVAPSVDVPVTAAQDSGLPAVEITDDVRDSGVGPTSDAGVSQEQDALPGGAFCGVSVADTDAGGGGLFTCLELGEGSFYECDCAGAATSSDAPDCASALEAACGVSPRISCEEGLGTCGASSPQEDFACACAGSPAEWSVRSAPSCESALVATCGTSCESAFGSCESVAGPLGFVGYDCDCDVYGLRSVGDNGQSCDGALQQTCDPGFGVDVTGPCNEESGYCHRGADGVWSCSCVSGLSFQFEPAILLGEERADSSCDTVIGVTCGPTDGVEDCQRDTAAGSAACTRVPGSYTTFDCACDSSCTESLVTTLVAPSCEAAMNASCGPEGPSCP